MGKYWLVRQPFWVRSLAAGAPFGIGMFFLMRFFEEGWMGVVAACGIGALFGVFFTSLADQLSRQILRADGAPLTANEVAEVLRGADTGRWPPDPHLRHPVERLARQRLRPSGSPWAAAAALSAALGYAVIRAATDDPIWWVFAGCVAPFAVWAVTRTRRQRHAAHRLMAQPPDEG